MNYGVPKVDRHLRSVMTKMLKSGRWELRPGKKHAKFVLLKTNQILVAPGSSSDPIHAKKNAGFETSSIE